jgi:hypothetical protein
MIQRSSFEKLETLLSHESNTKRLAINELLMRSRFVLQAQSMHEPAPIAAKQAAQAGTPTPVAHAVAHATTAAAQAIFLPSPQSCGSIPER